MSLPDTTTPTSVALTESPDFELECLFDDMENPTEVTVFFPEGERTATEWITADETVAVPVDDLR